MDTVAFAGGLYRRGHERLSTVAEHEQLRVDGVPGRQLLFTKHCRLLFDSLRSRIWAIREIRSRLRRASRRGEARQQSKTPESNSRLERRRGRARIDIAVSCRR